MLRARYTEADRARICQSQTPGKELEIWPLPVEAQAQLQQALIARPIRRERRRCRDVARCIHRRGGVEPGDVQPVAQVGGLRQELYALLLAPREQPRVASVDLRGPA